MAHLGTGRARRSTRRTRVADKLQRLILGRSPQLGERLPSVESLAGRFRVSVGTMHLALNDLEARGLLRKKHGAGVFVASQHAPISMRDAVAVCMESGTHLYGELWEHLMAALHERGMLPLGVDTRHGEAVALIDRLPANELGCYMVQAPSDVFRFLLDRAGAQGTPVIAFLNPPEEEGRLRYYRILYSRQAMARLMAAHLREQGFRRIVLLGTETDGMALARPELIPSIAHPLAREWESGGDHWTFLASVENLSATSLISYDEERLLALLREAPRATAVVGTRDVEAWEAQQVIRRRAPEMAAGARVFGFFDTPWSRAGSPPFTSVSVDIPAMVTSAMTMLDALRAGNEPREKSLTIPPRLVERG